jgi:hypothetical protein
MERERERERALFDTRKRSEQELLLIRNIDCIALLHIIYIEKSKLLVHTGVSNNYYCNKKSAVLFQVHFDGSFI